MEAEPACVESPALDHHPAWPPTNRSNVHTPVVLRQDARPSTTLRVVPLPACGEDLRGAPFRVWLCQNTSVSM